MEPNKDLDLLLHTGTLLALGADVIVMSDSSELGPIDPQIMLNDGHGNMISYSVLHYLDAPCAHSRGEAPQNLDVSYSTRQYYGNCVQAPRHFALAIAWTGTMFAFALGTFPVLALISLASVNLSTSRRSGLFFKTAGIIVIAFALLNLMNSFAVIGLIRPIVNI